MLSRRPPASLVFLAVLTAVAVLAAATGGAALYEESVRAARDHADALTGGSWRRGRVVITTAACGSCHVIPGIDGATGQVGPSLVHVGLRVTLAGRLQNDPQQMTRWIMHPQQLVPGSGMPEMGISPGDARDMAAYLYSRE
jgi:cytochrome c2